jgi:hypothetical protein
LAAGFASGAIITIIPEVKICDKLGKPGIFELKPIARVARGSAWVSEGTVVQLATGRRAQRGA